MKEKYIYTGITGNNARLGYKISGQEIDYVPEKYKDELLRNGQIKIKSASLPKKSKKVIEQKLKTNNKEV